MATLLKKDMYFLDISGYQPADMRAMTAAAGTDKTIIKLTESTSYYNSYAISQTNTSDCIGYYHFARFGGSVSQAQAEAAYFLSTVPKKVKYLVCDYEDSASGNKQANTNAVLAFMDAIKAAGYEPIYYSYRPFTIANIYHDQLNAKYPNSTWIAAYPNYAVTPDPVWSIFPSIDGVRWWQFTSTAIAGGLDKNVVLVDDTNSTGAADIAQTINKNTAGDDNFMYIFTATESLAAVNDNFKKFGKGATFLMVPQKNKVIYISDPGERDFYLNDLKLQEVKGGAVMFARCIQLGQKIG